MDAAGNVYVTGAFSDNVFEIRPDGTITMILDRQGDGESSLDEPRGIAVDALGNAYVSGFRSDNAFKIAADGTVTEIIDRSAGGAGTLDGAAAIAAEPLGPVYVAGLSSDNVFKILPDGTITQILDAAGDGSHPLEGASAIAEFSGQVYVAGRYSDNAFEISPHPALTETPGLLLPGVEAGGVDPVGPTTLFAVRNPTDEPVTGTIEVLGAGGTESLLAEDFDLGPRATLTRNLDQELSGLEVEDGLVRVTLPAGSGVPEVVGDYFRVDAGNGFASGGRLIRPADLCLRREVRFLDFGGGTRLRILVDRPPQILGNIQDLGDPPMPGQIPLGLAVSASGDATGRFWQLPKTSVRHAELFGESPGTFVQRADASSERHLPLVWRPDACPRPHPTSVRRPDVDLQRQKTSVRRPTVF